MARTRPVTLQRLADLCGVSIATASRVMAGDPRVSAATRAAVLAKAEEIGYAPLARPGLDGPARPGAPRASGDLGLVMNPAVLVESFFLRLVCAAQAEAEASGRRLVLAGPAVLADEAALRRLRLDGLLLQDTGDDDLHARMHAVLPTVVVMATEREHPCDAVGWDESAAVELALDRLLALGHRRIRFFDIHDHLRSGGRANVHHQARTAAWRRLVAARGLEQASCEVLPGREAPLDEVMARRLDAWLAEERRPTAILCGADVYGVPLVHAAQARALALPGDLSLIGIDDIDLCTALRPQLASVRAPQAEIGAEAVRLLLHRQASPRAPRQRRLLPVTLQERASIGPPA